MIVFTIKSDVYSNVKQRINKKQIIIYNLFIYELKDSLQLYILITNRKIHLDLL